MGRTAIAVTAGIALLLALVAVLGGAYLFLAERDPSGALPAEPTGPAFPSSGGSGQGGVTQETISLPADQGGTIVVRDFTEDGVTVEDPANPGTFYLAGGSGYCYEDGSCPAGYEAGNFIITYVAPDSAFVVALTQEPLGRARLDAERYLASALGIPPSSLCSLRHLVTTDSYTNAQYAGMELGFSMCEDSVPLP